jgi:hypothetical protein
MRVRAPAPPTLAALGAVVLLALIAIVSSHDGAPAYDSFASTDYRAGGYHAWVTLLAREGIATGRFVLRPIELDSTIDTLISAQPPPRATDPGARTAADIAALASWVRGGGRLVYAGRNAARPEAEKNDLQLPVLLHPSGARGALGGPAAAAVGSLAGLGAERMRLGRRAGETILADGNGDIVVRYPLGRGEVLAVADTVPFINANIARAQNARLAYLLGVPGRPGGLVAFDDGLHGALLDRPWYRALPIPVLVAVGIAGSALVLGLIGSALRGAPAMRLEPAREPTSAEFVAALAALYERTGARAAANAILAGDALAAAARSAGSDGREEPGRSDVRRLAHALDAAVATDAVLLANAKLAYNVRKESRYDGNGDGRRAAFAGRTRTHRRW